MNTTTTNTKKKIIGQYLLTRLLGRGVYGKVSLGENLLTGQQVAVKKIKHSNVNTIKEYEFMEREKKALALLDHPNIVKLLDVIEEEGKATYLIFEYVSGGDLFTYIVDQGRIAPNKAKLFMRQLVSALEYCHFNMIAHRDLKPENILIDQNQNIKITDFGLANFICPRRKFTTFCGSLLYAAPEILKGKPYNGPAVDIYASGVILFCLIFGCQPFSGECVHQVQKQISSERPWAKIADNELRDILSKMLHRDPKKRISVEKLRIHPWIMKGYSEPPQSFLPTLLPITKIDDKLMQDLSSLGFKDSSKNRNILLKNKQSPVLRAYQMMLHRRKDQLVD